MGGMGDFANLGDIVGINNGPILVNVHTADRCAGQWCCIHNPSQHHMIHWPADWNPNLKQMWRVCVHGYLHPDPDDLNYWRQRWSRGAAALMGVHTCDSCCQPDTEAPLKPVVPPPAKMIGLQQDKIEPYSVSHDPQWEPTQLQYNAAGDTKPGFHCVHQLENGNGICDSNVFTLDQAIGKHTCWVVP